MCDSKILFISYYYCEVTICHREPNQTKLNVGVAREPQGIPLRTLTAQDK